MYAALDGGVQNSGPNGCVIREIVKFTKTVISPEHLGAAAVRLTCPLCFEECHGAAFVQHVTEHGFAATLATQRCAVWARISEYVMDVKTVAELQTLSQGVYFAIREVIHNRRAKPAGPLAVAHAMDADADHSELFERLWERARGLDFD